MGIFVFRIFFDVNMSLLRVRGVIKKNNKKIKK